MPQLPALSVRGPQFNFLGAARLRQQQGQNQFRNALATRGADLAERQQSFREDVFSAEQAAALSESERKRLQGSINRRSQALFAVSQTPAGPQREQVAMQALQALQASGEEIAPERIQQLLSNVNDDAFLQAEVTRLLPIDQSLKIADQRSRADSAEQSEARAQRNEGRADIRIGLEQRRTAATERRAAKEDSPFGAGLTGGALQILLREKALRDGGEDIPPGLANQATAARHVLQQERITRGPEGVTSFTPGLPPGFGGEPERRTRTQSVPEPEPLTRQPLGPENVTQTPGGGELRSITGPRERQADRDFSRATQTSMETIERVVDLLEAAARDSETITGLAGTARNLGGGLTRQAGINVSPKAERLNALLTTLQGQLGPILLNEKRLSETERQRLREIVGNVSPTMDEVALRERLADIVDFIEAAGKK